VQGCGEQGEGSPRHAELTPHPQRGGQAYDAVECRGKKNEKIEKKVLVSICDLNNNRELIHEVCVCVCVCVRVFQLRLLQ
jgi:hypothetical protein